MKTIWITNKEEIEDIILSCNVCFVGMIDEEGLPYSIPMNFGYENSVIYLHSGQEGKKIDCIKKENRVCITFCQENSLAYVNKEVACSYTMKSKSVLAQCEVSFVEDENLDEKGKILNVFMKHYSPMEFKYSVPALKNVKVWKAEIKKITCKEFGAPHQKNNNK